LISNNI